MSATAASREERPGRGFGSERVREALVGYLFIAAPMVLYGILFFYPIGYALYISRYDWGILGKIDAVGLGTTANCRPTSASASRSRTASSSRSRCRSSRWRSACSSRSWSTTRSASGVLPLRLLLPLDRLVGVITAVALFILSADGLFNEITGLDHAWFGESGTSLWALSA